jgi:hypothetical protein
MAETHEIRRDAVTARDLMLAPFAGISPDATLHEARKKLVELQADSQSPNALVIEWITVATRSVLPPRSCARKRLSA